MPLLAPPGPLPAAAPQLEGALGEVEARLADVGAALRARDAAAIDLHAGGLHRALAQAAEQFSRAARRGPVTPALRERLVRASGEVAAHREVLARACAALDRAIDVLLPREAGALYSNGGAADRGTVRSGMIQA